MVSIKANDSRHRRGYGVLEGRQSPVRRWAFFSFPFRAPRLHLPILVSFYRQSRGSISYRRTCPRLFHLFAGELPCLRHDFSSISFSGIFPVPLILFPSVRRPSPPRPSRRRSVHLFRYPRAPVARRSPYPSRLTCRALSVSGGKQA